MLRIVQTTHAGNAKEYHLQEFEHEDKYTGAERAKGVWLGQAARLLSLSGNIRERDWSALCDNHVPGTTETLTGRNLANRTVAYDFNFNCPKSFSIMATVGGENEAVPAFVRAMRATMVDHVEPDAETRVRRGGDSSNRFSRNLVWGEFIHHTARPVRGLTDMHVHGHSYVFNATFDPVEDVCKAVQFFNLKRDAGYYEALFLSQLATSVRELGYDIRPMGKYWGIEGVPQKLVKEFSQRDAQVTRAADERGEQYPERRARYGTWTREDKGEAKSDAAYLAEWQSRMRPGDAAALKACRHHRMGRVLGGDRSAMEVAQHAMNRVFAHSAVVTERRLMEEAVRISWDHTRMDEFRQAFASLGVVTRDRNGRAMVTTKEAVQEEEGLVKMARDGRNRYRPIRPAALDPSKYADLSNDQRNMVNHVVQSKDFITLVEGVAGAGKTKALKAIHTEIKLSTSLATLVLPDRFIALAPTAQAARDVLRKDGFEEANTVAKFLMDTEGMSVARTFGEKMLGRVVVVDEAQMLGTKDWVTLCDRVRKMGGRIVALYDPLQHESVARGNVPELLRVHAKLPATRMQQIMRQSGDYKAAVNAFANGRPAEGFSRLTAMGVVHEAGRREVVKQACDDYIKARESTSSVALLAPTNKLVHELNTEVRARFKEQGQLKRERQLVQYREVQSTTEDRANPAWYQKGQMVQFHQNCRGIRANTRLTVCGSVGGNVLGTGMTGIVPVPTVIPVNRADSFRVFEKGSINVAVGDRIRITQNTKVYSKLELATHSFRNAIPPPTHDLNNRSVHEVAGFNRRGDIILQNKLVIPRKFGHIDHAYAATTYSMQGATLNRAILVATMDAGPAVSFKQTYTGVSRGKESVAVYTDNKNWLREAVQRQHETIGALDLVDGGHAGQARPSRGQERVGSETRRPGRNTVAPVVDKERESSRNQSDRQSKGGMDRDR